MRRATTVVLLSLSPFLMATDIDLALEGDKPATLDEKRDALRQFNHELDGVIASQIEEIASLDPSRNVELLREAHYVWKLKRDLDCAEKRRSAADSLAELECRSQAGEKYYQDREVELAELEAKIASE